MKIQLCQYGCGHPAIYTTKGSLTSGPFKGAPIHRCAKSHHACPAIKAKKIATSVKNYGTEYPWQTKEVIEKRDKTNIEKYGNAFSLKNTEVANRRKETMIARYGVEQPTSNKKIAAKVSVSVTQSYINDPLLTTKQVQAKIFKYGADYSSIVKKCQSTQIANGRWTDPALKSEWERYKDLVKKLSGKNYRKNKEIINPDNLPTGVCKYQLDHIYSIRHGFENNVDPSVIAHTANLRMLWHIDNKSKHIRCDITLEELLVKIKAA